MRRKLLTPLIGPFALVSMVGCEVLLVSGHLGNAAPSRRGGAVGVVDNDKSRPTVGDGDSDRDGVSDGVTERSQQRE